MNHHPDFFPPTHDTQNWAENLYDSTRALERAFSQDEWQQVVLRESCRAAQQTVRSAMEDQGIHGFGRLIDREAPWQVQQQSFYNLARDFFGEELTQGQELMHDFVDFCADILEDGDIERYMTQAVIATQTEGEFMGFKEREDALTVVNSSSYVSHDKVLLSQWHQVINKLLPGTEETVIDERVVSDEEINLSKDVFPSRHLFATLLRSVDFFEKVDAGVFQVEHAVKLLSEMFLTAHDVEFFSRSTMRECIERIDGIYETAELPLAIAEEALSNLEWYLEKATNA